MFLSCHVRVSEWIHILYLSECQGTPCSKQARNLKFTWNNFWKDPSSSLTEFHWNGYRKFELHSILMQKKIMCFNQKRSKPATVFQNYYLKESSWVTRSAFTLSPNVQTIQYRIIQVIGLVTHFDSNSCFESWTAVAASYVRIYINLQFIYKSPLF